MPDAVQPDPTPAPAPRYTGRVRVGPPRVAVPAPGPVAAPAPAPEPVNPVARPTGRPQGRVSLRGMRSAPAPVIAPEPVVEVAPAPELALEPVVEVAPDPYAVPADPLRGSDYVQPLTASGMPWRRPTSYRPEGARRWRALAYDPLRLFSGEPHGPPCPEAQHPVWSLRNTSAMIPF